MFTSMHGTSVVITGASKGIGKGIAEVFASAGARLTLVGRDASALEATAEQVRADGVEVVTCAADVADRSACDTVAAATTDAFGGIDVVCANAGIFPEAPLATMTADELEQTLAVNLKGTVFVTQACLPALAASGRGRVVVTSSITGPITGVAGWSHYGASKAGQLGFVRAAAVELAPQAITVNAVLPGNVLTEGLSGLGEDYLAAMTRSIPLGRLGSVADIGHACLFLASVEAGFVTGQTIVVDGGQVLPEALS